MGSGHSPRARGPKAHTLPFTPGRGWHLAGHAAGHAVGWGTERGRLRHYSMARRQLNLPDRGGMAGADAGIRRARTTHVRHRSRLTSWTASSAVTPSGQRELRRAARVSRLSVASCLSWRVDGLCRDIKRATGAP